jgi:alditol oxidase
VVLNNWGGNLSFKQPEVLAPTSLDELAKLVRSNRVRPAGTLHSFSDVVAGEGVLVSAAGLPIEPEILADGSTVRVGAASRFGDIALFLEANGLALQNMGSLPHISLAGASATGTHGSGDGNPILSTSLRAFSFVNYEGELKTLRRGDPLFETCRLGMGAYGIWVSAELETQPSYQMRQDIYRGVPWQFFVEDPARLTGAGYSVSLFGKWGGQQIDKVWVKSRIDQSTPPDNFAGIGAETKSLAELAAGVGDNLTEQGGKPGPWLHRLPHFRLDATPSAGDEIQTEYFVLRDQIAGAIAALHSLANEINPVLIISEIRTIASDDAWLSPMRRGDSIALHFTWQNDVPAVTTAVAKVEAVLAEFDPIPHWGKLHGFSGEQLERVHPKLAAARAEFDQLDPMGKFSSPNLQSIGVRS